MFDPTDELLDENVYAKTVLGLPPRIESHLKAVNQSNK